jgi:minor extracellular serine protease Vpr
MRPKSRLSRRPALSRRVAIAGSAFVLALAASVGLASAQGGASKGSEHIVLSKGEWIDLSAEDVKWRPASLDLSRKATVILELAGAPVGKHQAEARKAGKELSNAERAALRAELKGNQDELTPRIAAAGGQVVADYQDAYNGLAVRVPLKNLSKLSGLPGVLAVHPSRTFEPSNAAGAQYIRAHNAWQDTGFTGAGVQVAVLDTGVDYYHANFGGSGDPADFEADNGLTIEPGTFPTAKVVGGTDFVGDDYDADSDDPATATPDPDPDPLDCNGHGSHVAGTAAGFGVLSDGSTYTGPYNAGIYASNSFEIGPGVAPEADVLAYRVFGCAGSSSEEVIVDALNQALVDGADVVNMSLGSVFGRDDEPSTEASDTLSLAGVVVVASAGNAGPSGYITDGPAVADRSISVAAVDASGPSFPGANVALSTGQSVLAQNSNGAALPSGPLPVAVLRTSYPDGPVSLGCDPAEYTNFPGGVAGKLVVTVRGTCARVARAIFGEQAGAAAVAMINTSSGYPPFEGRITSNPDTGEEFTVTIPFLGIRGVLGPSPTDDPEKLVAADGGTATLSAAPVPNPGFQRAASFTSGGPENVSSEVKPDVTAPGVSVVSTLVGSGTVGTRISGTSMSAPMTAGVAALVSEAHPAWLTEHIKAAIVNTADVSTSTIAAGAYNVRLFGSGVVDARRAVDTVGFVTTADATGTLSFGQESLGAAYSETLPITIHNTSGSQITYDLSASFNGGALGARASISPRSVRVPENGSATANVTLTLSGSNVAALPGMSTFTIGWGSVLTARGVVVAAPKGNNAGAYPLRVPFLVAPRGLSNVTAGAKAPYSQSGGVATSSVPLTNSGIHRGDADVYAWGIQDGDDVAHPEDSMDVRAAGVQSLPGDVLGGAPDDRSLVFAINVHGKASNQAVSEFDVVIDTENDGRADFFVVGVDFGAVTAGEFDGRMASFIFDAAGNLINAWVADNPMNGSTVLLPTLASDIGLKAGNDSFFYAINAFSIVPGDLIDTTAVAEYQSHSPAVSNGQFISLAPGASATLGLSVDRVQFNKAPALGWLVATLDDPNGGAQAELIPVGKLP